MIFLLGCLFALPANAETILIKDGCNNFGWLYHDPDAGCPDEGTMEIWVTLPALLGDFRVAELYPDECVKISEYTWARMVVGETNYRCVWDDGREPTAFFSATPLRPGTNEGRCE
jgi:hypothetical protein